MRGEGRKEGKKDGDDGDKSPHDSRHHSVSPEASALVKRASPSVRPAGRAARVEEVVVGAEVRA